MDWKNLPIVLHGIVSMMTILYTHHMLPWQQGDQESKEKDQLKRMTSLQHEEPPITILIVTDHPPPRHHHQQSRRQKRNTGKSGKNRPQLCRTGRSSLQGHFLRHLRQHQPSLRSVAPSPRQRLYTVENQEPHYDDFLTTVRRQNRPSLDPTSFFPSSRYASLN